MIKICSHDSLFNKGVYTIHRVRLYNRLDCCSERLSNFDVYFYNASGSIVYTHNQITQVGENIDITVPNISANKMKVYLLGSNLRILTLCEVEVYTYDINCPSSLPSAYPSIYPSLSLPYSLAIYLVLDHQRDPVYFPHQRLQFFQPICYQ